MIRLLKSMLIINIATLAINGIIVWLTIVRAFPPILGILLFIAIMAGFVWLSCWLNGKLPPKKRRTSLYAAPTEKVGSL